MKFLYHEKRLFKIVSEDKHNFKVQKCKEIVSDFIKTMVNFKITTHDDYIFIGCFKLKDGVCFIFSKQNKNYLIIEDFDINYNHLCIRSNFNKLSYELVLPFDILPFRRVE
jgi:hypothetical protein